MTTRIEPCPLCGLSARIGEPSWAPNRDLLDVDAHLDEIGRGCPAFQIEGLLCVKLQKRPQADRDAISQRIRARADAGHTTLLWSVPGDPLGVAFMTGAVP